MQRAGPIRAPFGRRSAPSHGAKGKGVQARCRAEPELEPEPEAELEAERGAGGGDLLPRGFQRSRSRVLRRERPFPATGVCLPADVSSPRREYVHWALFYGVPYSKSRQEGLLVHRVSALA